MRVCNSSIIAQTQQRHNVVSEPTTTEHVSASIIRTHSSTQQTSSEPLGTEHPSLQQSVNTSQQQSGDFIAPRSQQTMSNISRGRKDLNEGDRMKCIVESLQRSSELVLPRGYINELPTSFGVSRWTISRLWKDMRNSIMLKEKVKVAKGYKGKVGRKAMPLVTEDLMAIPLEKRSNIWSLAKALNLSRATVHRHVKKGKIERHSNVIKPTLTAANKIQ